MPIGRPVGREGRKRARDLGPGAHLAIERDRFRVGVGRPEPCVGALRRAPKAPDRLVRVVGGDQDAALAAECLQQLGVRRRRVLELVRHHVPVALANRVGDVGPFRQEPRCLHHEIAAVEASGVAEDPVVAGIQLRELDLATRPLPLRGTSGLAVAGSRPVA